MKTITVCKAKPVGDEVIESVILRLDGAMQPFGVASYDDYARFYEAEASKIMEALVNLPGGTRHQLLIKMLEDKLPLFNVK